MLTKAPFPTQAKERLSEFANKVGNKVTQAKEGIANMAKPAVTGKALGMQKKAAAPGQMKKAGVSVATSSGSRTAGSAMPALGPNIVSQPVNKGMGKKMSAPGQMKKAAGVKGSAKAYAPGQTKKAPAGTSVARAPMGPRKPMRKGVM